MGYTPNLLAAQSDKSQGESGDRVHRITTAGEAVIVCLGKAFNSIHHEFPRGN